MAQSSLNRWPYHSATHDRIKNQLSIPSWVFKVDPSKVKSSFIVSPSPRSLEELPVIYIWRIQTVESPKKSVTGKNIPFSDLNSKDISEIQSEFEIETFFNRHRRSAQSEANFSLKFELFKKFPPKARFLIIPKIKNLSPPGIRKSYWVIPKPFTNWSAR